MAWVAAYLMVGLACALLFATLRDYFDRQDPKLKLDRVDPAEIVSIVLLWPLLLLLALAGWVGC